MQTSQRKCELGDVLRPRGRSRDNNIELSIDCTPASETLPAALEIYVGVGSEMEGDEFRVTMVDKPGPGGDEDGDRIVES